MTIEKFEKIIKDNNIPKDTSLMSDSGWECCATNMDGVWYSKEKKEIVFTQGICHNCYENGYVELYERNK